MVSIVQSAGRDRRVALLLLCLAQLMCILDISIVNIAVPSIQKDLALASSSVQWVISAYVLTYGGFLLVGGRLGDLYGRRRMLLFGLVGFTLASAVGGMSQSAGALLAARAGQGLGGSIITPTVMSLIAGLFEEGEARNRALGLLGAVTGAGFALGLVLGGLLTSTVGWRWVFFINLPIGLLVIPAIGWVLSETEKEKQSVNVPGAIFATSGLALMVYTLTETERYGLFSLNTLIGAAIALILLYFFVVMERRAAHPLIPPGLLREGSLLQALIGSTTFGTVVGPSTLILTLYLQNVGGFDPLSTGLAFLPQEVTVFLAANLAGRMVSRFGSRKVLASGIAALGLGALIMTRMSVTGEYTGAILPGLLVIGLGIGAVNVAGSISATEGISPLRHGASTGIWNTGTQFGTALGLAVLTAVANGRANTLREVIPAIDPSAATVSGYQWAFAVGVCFALIGAGALFVLPKARPKPLDFEKQP